jgi:hypothetical protein
MIGHEEGGGASRSTDPASGTSAATDVSLREYSSRDLWWLDRHLSGKIEALEALMRSNRAADQEAVKTAFKASQELAAKHNDLIRQQEKKDATYATKNDVSRVESWQSRLTGGMVVVAVIGVANLVKVWTG